MTTATSIQIGSRVSYEDMANPRREGRIVGEIAGQWAVRWDEGERVYNLTEQHGIFFHTTVTKNMLARHASRPGAGWDVVDEAASISSHLLAKALREATSSVFDGSIAKNGWGGYDLPVHGFGDVGLVRFTRPDSEVDSYDVHVFSDNLVVLATATVPLCAVVAATDAMVRSLR